MQIDTNLLVPMTEANQNFSKVARLVDEKGSAIILKNNKPRYVVINFDEYAISHAENSAKRRKLFEDALDQIMEENHEAFKELAK